MSKDIKLKIAVPNKGALSEGAVALLAQSGYKCNRSSRELSVTDAENGIEFLFLRPRDIALYVAKGIIDMGITGRDLAIDSGAEVIELMPLGTGKSRFCFAGPKGKFSSIQELNNLTIATSYPTLLKQNLDKMGLTCPIVRLDGADAIADVVESGSTLREAGLEILGEPMIHSEAIIIGRSEEIGQTEEARRLMARIRGILLASRYLMIEYDVERAYVDACCKITPGLEAPTVSPLSNPDWVAVKAMVLRKDINLIMDELYEVGARGIITTELRSCRL